MNDLGAFAGSTGSIAIAGTSSEAGYATFAEDTDNGTNKVKVQAPASISADYTVTLPASAGTVALTSDITPGTSLQTSVATTSGATVDISTTIPSTVKAFTLNFIGVSTNGTAVPLVQLGDSGGFETSGYSATAVTSSFTTGFGLGGTLAANVYYGSMRFVLADASNNTWNMSGVLAIPTSPNTFYVAGSKSLSAALDRVRLFTTDAFDAGSVSLSFEY